MATFEIGISSADAIELFPQYNYKRRDVAIQNKHRTKSGKLYTYQWGTYLKINFGLDLVVAANAAIINSWWQSETELLLFVVSDSVVEVNSVMITNNETPLNQFEPPYDEYYKGKIELTDY